MGKEGDVVNMKYRLTLVLHGLPAQLPMHFKAP